MSDASVRAAARRRRRVSKTPPAAAAGAQHKHAEPTMGVAFDTMHALIKRVPLCEAARAGAPPRHAHTQHKRRKLTAHDASSGTSSTQKP